MKKVRVKVRKLGNYWDTGICKGNRMILETTNSYCEKWEVVELSQ